MAAMAKRLVFAFLLAVVILASSTGEATTLTMHNLCPCPVWPVVTPNTGFPSISDNTVRLDGNGRGLVSFRFPVGSWSGRVVARTGCASPPSRCETGTAPPATVVQLSVHAAVGDRKDLATYSVSLVDGFNVPAVVSPQDFHSGAQCPALGCAEDLNAGCPPAQRVTGAGGVVVACRPGTPGYFKQRCPLTRTTPTDVEPVPQRCHGPHELKVVLCQPSMVGADATAEPALTSRSVVVTDN